MKEKIKQKIWKFTWEENEAGMVTWFATATLMLLIGLAIAVNVFAQDEQPVKIVVSTIVTIGLILVNAFIFHNTKTGRKNDFLKDFLKVVMDFSSKLRAFEKREFEGMVNSKGKRYSHNPFVFDYPTAREKKLREEVLYISQCVKNSQNDFITRNLEPHFEVLMKNIQEAEIGKETSSVEEILSTLAMVYKEAGAVGENERQEEKRKEKNKEANTILEQEKNILLKAFGQRNAISSSQFLSEYETSMREEAQKALKDMEEKEKNTYAAGYVDGLKYAMAEIEKVK